MACAECSTSAAQGCSRRLAGERWGAQEARLAARHPGSRQTDRRALQVVCAKGKGKKIAMQQQAGGGMPQAPPVPEVDPDNAEFVIFVKPDTSPNWAPVSILKGSSGAKSLLRLMEYDFGKLLYGATLVRQIAEGIYKEQDKIEVDLKRAAPPYIQAAKSFQYGFKVRDKSKPKEWMVPDGIIQLPPKDQLPGNGLENARAFFGSIFGGGQ